MKAVSESTRTYPKREAIDGTQREKSFVPVPTAAAQPTTSSEMAQESTLNSPKPLLLLLPPSLSFHPPLSFSSLYSTNFHSYF